MASRQGLARPREDEAPSRAALNPGSAGALTGVDPQRSEADCVCRDAVVTDAADGALHGDGPLALIMEVTVHAGCHVGLFEALDARTGP